MIRRLAIAAFVTTVLTGCATSPADFGQSVNNAVDNTHTAAVATVSIGTEILHAVIALTPAVLDVIGIWQR